MGWARLGLSPSQVHWPEWPGSIFLAGGCEVTSESYTQRPQHPEQQLFEMWRWSPSLREERKPHRSDQVSLAFPGQGQAPMRPKGRLEARSLWWPCRHLSPLLFAGRSDVTLGRGLGTPRAHSHAGGQLGSWEGAETVWEDASLPDTGRAGLARSLPSLLLRRSREAAVDGVRTEGWAESCTWIQTC